MDMTHPSRSVFADANSTPLSSPNSDRVFAVNSIALRCDEIHRVYIGIPTVCLGHNARLCILAQMHELL